MEVTRPCISAHDTSKHGRTIKTGSHEYSKQEEISPSATGNPPAGCPPAHGCRARCPCPCVGQSDTVKPSRDDLELDLERLMEAAWQPVQSMIATARVG